MRKMTKFNNNKEIKIKLINQIDIKDSFKLLKSYNGVQCYLDDNTEIRIISWKRY